MSIICSLLVIGTVWHLLVISASYAQRLAPPLDAYTGFTAPGTLASLSKDPDLLSRCKERYRRSTLDHFSWAIPDHAKETFLQRYFTCDDQWQTGGPIFFYVGNEADVTLYLNNTGLMWESAKDFQAMLVFAEHRYYGRSKPFEHSIKHMQYLTSEQALADYAELLTELKAELHADDSPVIGFGGSYGGMLATWFRLKYPHILDGAIAGSAPIWMFLGEEPPYDPDSFAEGVTYDASPAAGSLPGCVPNARKAWQRLFDLGQSDSGRRRIRESMRLCPEASMTGPADAEALVDWAASAFDYMSMGNYPYPSSYILNGAGMLPPYPVRVACASLGKEGLDTDASLLSGLADAIGVFYNNSGMLSCFDFGSGVNPDTDSDGLFWDYQYCTEQVNPEGKSGVKDMFWRQPWTKASTAKACRAQWGVEPRFLWNTVYFGGKKLSALSNVVFSNGLYDPWHGGGVLQNLSSTVTAVVIPEGAHHLDLMFSNPLDPASVKAARATERQSIAKWIAEAHKAHMAAS